VFWIGGCASEEGRREGIVSGRETARQRRTFIAVRRLSKRVRRRTAGQASCTGSGLTRQTHGSRLGRMPWRKGNRAYLKYVLTRQKWGRISSPWHKLLTVVCVVVVVYFIVQRLAHQDVLAPKGPVPTQERVIDPN
jgi:hypothetical protein